MICAALVCLLVAGCGGSGSQGSSGSAETPTTEGTAGVASAPEKHFATLKLAWGVPDFLDPGLSYDARGWDILEHVYLGLLTYKRTSGKASTELIPGLAEAMPTVSKDGLTYTFKLRPGLKYSDGKPVLATDFRSTIERVIRLNSGGATFYNVIVGAEEFAKTKKGQITGIEGDNSTRTVTFRLTHPRGDFENIIAMIFASPVPAGTPAEDQSTNPIPATGPYEIVSYKPNESFVLERNPDWSHIPGIPDGNPDRVEGKIFDDDTAALQAVINGEDDYDPHTVPPDRIALVKQKYAQQLRLFVPSGTRYFFLNHDVAPFNDKLVRQAVNYALDREAIVGLYGGLAAATQNYLPPGYPSYKKIDYYKYDLTKARELVQKAGAVGDPVTVWGLSDEPVARRTIDYLTGQLNAIGLDAKEKLLQSAAYYGAIFDPARKAQIGWNEWIQDYPHPADWFDLVLDGENIQKENNYDVGMVDIPRLNKKIAELDELPADKETNPQWAKLDREFIVGDAAMAPYVNQIGTDFFSTRMDLSQCYVSQVLYGWDWTQSCLEG